MQHLNDEDLARLADEDPAPEEEAHLVVCGYCAAEVDEMRGQLRALAGLPDLEPPPRCRRACRPDWRWRV